jgi:hypothetical protein
VDEQLNSTSLTATPPHSAPANDRTIDYERQPTQASIDEGRLETAGALSIVWGFILLFGSILISPLLAEPMSESMVMPSPAPYGDLGRLTGDLSYLTWVLLLLVLLLGCLTMASGRCLITHRRRSFSVKIAILNCLLVPPLGTVLGIYTLLVLRTASVKDEYAQTEALDVEEKY